MTHKFNPAHAVRLLDEERRAWNDPVQILRHLELMPGATLADIGCGPGWFTLDAARQVGPSGRVWAVDLSADMLKMVQERAAEAGLTNVLPVLAEDEAEWPIPSQSVDYVLLANVLHEVDPASLFVTELQRILKPGSACLVVEWKAEPMPGGPPLQHRLNPADIIVELAGVGFVSEGLREVGPYHYGLKFRFGVD